MTSSDKVSMEAYTYKMSGLMPSDALLLSFWLIDTVILTFLKQMFLEVIFGFGGSEITFMELAGCALSARTF